VWYLLYSLCVCVCTCISICAGSSLQATGRVLNQLVASDFGITQETCAASCNLAGYGLMGLTAHAPSNPPPLVYCYCGHALDPEAAPAAASECDITCPSASWELCGGSGYMLAFNTSCAGLPPAPPPGPPLPTGPACSQTEAKKWKFCNTSVALDDRVWDLVNRVSIAEAGAQLTARQAPAISRLGIPSFYWGTNVNQCVISLSLALASYLVRLGMV